MLRMLRRFHRSGSVQFDQFEEPARLLDLAAEPNGSSAILLRPGADPWELSRGLASIALALRSDVPILTESVPGMERRKRILGVGYGTESPAASCRVIWTGQSDTARHQWLKLMKIFDCGAPPPLHGPRCICRSVKVREHEAIAMSSRLESRCAATEYDPITVQPSPAGALSGRRICGPNYLLFPKSRGALPADHSQQMCALFVQLVVLRVEAAYGNSHRVPRQLVRGHRG